MTGCRWIALSLLAFIAILIGIGALLMTSVFNIVHEFRYRIAVEFDTPEGIKGGASVIRVTRRSPLPIDPFQKYTWKLEGDAIFVDLGSGKNAIMLLTHGETAGTGDSFLGLWAMAYGYSPYGDEDVWTGKIKLSGLRELTGKLVPTIITFTDLTDPVTAKVIHATGYRQECRDKTRTMPNCQPDNIPFPIDAIADTLGQGYAFRRATLEIVPNTTPVTRGIEAKLPWYGVPFDQRRNPDGSRLTPEQIRQLQNIPGPFKRNY